MFLLDANVLIALGESTHVHHGRVQQWFHSQPGRVWATCPLTENAFLRIVGSRKYPGYVGEPKAIRTLLQQMCTFPGHQFWTDSISLCDPLKFPNITISKHLTDLYLLGVAVARKAQLVTLDKRIDPKMVPGGIDAYFLIP